MATAAAKPVRHSRVRAKAAAKPSSRSAAHGGSFRTAGQRPIEFYYWPTPNGWKISIMLEECGLPYTLRPVNIGKGEQFDPDFLKFSPNNRIPAIVDPKGPGGKPVSVFESGAILMYLGRKAGKFYPYDERQRVDVEQWLFWQMGGLGPMAGQANHFRHYAPEQLHYAIERYTNEVHRLYGVMDKRLSNREYLAGKYSIADIACFGWVSLHHMQGQNLDEFPNLKGWYLRVGARAGVKRGMAVGAELRQRADISSNPDARRILFGQRARN